MKQTPVFRLVIQYLFWKTKKEYLDLSGLGVPSSLQGVSMQQEAEKQRVIGEIIGFGEAGLDEQGRCELASKLAERAEVDYKSMTRHRVISLMDSREIAELAASGLDVQLHTHRHRLPADKVLVQREITQNREYLEPIVMKKLDHLCYPSGIWSTEHWPWLHELGIATATTCDVGLNYKGTPPLGLKRFLDGENVHQIEFEAELSGFSELMRRTWSALFGAARSR